jgi:N-acetylglucosamine kinase-like BadF-type ATPase
MKPEGGETQLLLAVDGGGTKTVACLARRSDDGRIEILGKGKSGPGNPRGPNAQLAYGNIVEAVRSAFAAAQREPGCVPRACLALAGVGDEKVRLQVRQWASELALAAQVRVVHDGEAVLAAAETESAAVALIAGTGSFAYGRGVGERAARAGGWGSLLGDEGSAFALGLEALRSVCRAADGRARKTCLTAALLDHSQVGRVEELVAIYSTPRIPRESIAHLARFVTAACDAGDEVACGILDHAASQLADMVRAVVARITPREGTYMLAAAGGLLVGSAYLRKQIEHQLATRDASPERMALVRDPVLGALTLAAQQ